ncbi:MAG: DNA polymerase III subunit beta [Cellvibrionaceae bacterium]|nr:DNA polymerase III subunit beta [Cellvibrionaceae bacterium]
MKFTVTREALLPTLQLVAGVVERRQTQPVLANILLVLEGNRLALTGTDTEVELIGHLTTELTQSDGEITVPARKLVDICRSLPDASSLEFTLDDDQRMKIKSGRSRFTLSTLPANDFPATEPNESDVQFTSPQYLIKRLIDATAFAMAQQDVRYYLNGMLWEVHQNRIRCVATDGHRLALCTRELDIDVPENKQAILPRKGVIEMSRLLEDSDDVVQLTLGLHHIRVKTQDFTFTSKLVDGKFPDYKRVLPTGGSNIVLGNREELKQAFARASILSNEKYRGVRLSFEDSLLTIVANNPEQEEAEEQVPIDYQGDSIEIGFNVSYLQDVTNVLDNEKIKITLTDANGSALLEASEPSDALYVVMPMRL